MAKVNLTIGTQQFTLACDAGEEPRIEALAQKLNDRYQTMSQAFSGAGPQMIMAVTALMMQDELEQLPQKANEPIASEALAHSEENIEKQVNTRLTQIIHELASKIETLAAS